MQKKNDTEACVFLAFLEVTLNWMIFFFYFTYVSPNFFFRWMECLSTHSYRRHISFNLFLRSLHKEVKTKLKEKNLHLYLNCVTFLSFKSMCWSMAYDWSRARAREEREKKMPKFKQPTHGFYCQFNIHRKYVGEHKINLFVFSYSRFSMAIHELPIVATE